MNLNWYKTSSEEALETSNIDDELIKELDNDIWVPVKSSFIKAIAYHRYAQVLEVKFLNDNVYTFMAVPERVYDMFLSHPSKGQFFNLILKNYSQHFQNILA